MQLFHLFTSPEDHSDNIADSTGQDFSHVVTTNPPPIIYVSHGCLLIPVFLAAWWYYTKEACRSFVRGFLRNRPEPHYHRNDASDGSGCFNNCNDKDNSGNFDIMEDAYFNSQWYVFNKRRPMGQRDYVDLAGAKRFTNGVDTFPLAQNQFIWCVLPTKGGRVTIQFR